jgi:hypothetical protein
MSNYDQLDSNEKIALEIAIVYPHKAYSTVLPNFYEKGFSRGTLYRYHAEGVKKLEAKGFLDRQGRPTSLAFQIIPNGILKEMISKIHFHIVQITEETSREKNSFITASTELRKTKEHSEEVETALRKAQQQLAELSQNRVRNVIQTFSSFGLDENWVSVLVALNIVEIAMKRKVASFGIEANGKFNELLNILRREIRDKEKREFGASSAFLKEADLYAFRSKMDHSGLENKISDREAEFIIEQASKLVESLKIP